MCPHPLNIFIHRASECLTDHLPHGDGLICFTLIQGLVKRGHRVFAYTETNGVSAELPGLTILSKKHKVPFNSLAAWEHSLRADRWLKQLGRDQRIDLVWRMHPFGASGCPLVPYTGGRPLVIGPLFYSWPDREPAGSGAPRFGIGVKPLLKPIAEAGWKSAVRHASLLFCATDRHTRAMQSETNGAVRELPVIVNVPAETPRTRSLYDGKRPLRLVFVANLVQNKNPQILCETLSVLQSRGIFCSAVFIGDGPEKPALQALCRQLGVSDAVQFPGRMPNREVFSRIAEADILVSASLGEPYGRSIVEAMAVGTVPVCHRSGGPVDFIEDGRDGFLVDDLSALAYANTIETLHGNPQSVRTASCAAESKARNWTTDVVIDRVESEIYGLVGKPRI